MIDIIIEIIDGDIDNVIFENFAKILIKFNVQLQILQFLQIKIKKNVCNKWKNITSIEDFEDIKILFILQKFHKLTV